MGVPRAAIGRLLRAMVLRAKRLLVGPVGVGLVALTSFVAPLSAQSARDREGLAAFVDSLAAASDNEAIRAIERGLMARARRAFSTVVGSALQLVLPNLQPGHG